MKYVFKAVYPKYEKLVTLYAESYEQALNLLYYPEVGTQPESAELIKGKR